MTSPIIRHATSADIGGIADVHVRAWQWAYRGLMPAAFLESLDPADRARTWTRVLTNPNGARPIVAVANETIVGFCHADTSQDADASAAVGEVTAIYLAPEHVGTGTGYGLWNAALSDLKSTGHTDVTVWVLDTNTRGRAFYERVGLSPDGETKSDDVRGFPVTELRYRLHL